MIHIRLVRLQGNWNWAILIAAKIKIDAGSVVATRLSTLRIVFFGHTSRRIMADNSNAGPKQEKEHDQDGHDDDGSSCPSLSKDLDDTGAVVERRNDFNVRGASEDGAGSCDEVREQVDEGLNLPLSSSIFLENSPSMTEEPFIVSDAVSDQPEVTHDKGDEIVPPGPQASGVDLCWDTVEEEARNVERLQSGRIPTRPRRFGGRLSVNPPTPLEQKEMPSGPRSGRGRERCGDRFLSCFATASHLSLISEDSLPNFLSFTNITDEEDNTTRNDRSGGVESSSSNTSSGTGSRNRQQALRANPFFFDDNDEGASPGHSFLPTPDSLRGHLLRQQFVAIANVHESVSSIFLDMQTGDESPDNEASAPDALTLTTEQEFYDAQGYEDTPESTANNGPNSSDLGNTNPAPENSNRCYFVFRFPDGLTIRFSQYRISENSTETTNEEAGPSSSSDPDASSAAGSSAGTDRKQ